MNGRLQAALFALGVLTSYAIALASVAFFIWVGVFHERDARTLDPNPACHLLPPPKGK